MSIALFLGSVVMYIAWIEPFHNIGPWFVAITENSCVRGGENVFIVDMTIEKNDSLHMLCPYKVARIKYRPKLFFRSIMVDEQKTSVSGDAWKFCWLCVREPKPLWQASSPWNNFNIITNLRAGDVPLFRTATTTKSLAIYPGVGITGAYVALLQLGHSTLK
jgi:hypothetical protein